MTASPEPVIAVMSPASVPARQVLRAYFAEVASRYYGRPATDEEVAAAMREEPSDDLTPPGGLLLVAVQDGAVLGCAGLRLLPGGIGEVTRVYVMPAARRRGLGSRLLDELETHARDHQVTTLRLDTRRDLVEARQLYARHGYTEVRPLTGQEHETLPLFEAVRAIFDVGVPAKYVDHWGSAYLYASLDRTLDQLRRSMARLT